MAGVVLADCVYVLDGDYGDERLDAIEEMDCLEVAEGECVHTRDVHVQG